MKMSCAREGLLSAFQLVSAAMPSRDVKPILKNVKAIVEGDRCTLMATDLEVGIRYDVLGGLNVEESGEAILPASKFLAILRESTDDELTVEADASACTVRSVGGEWEMASEDPANFPDLPEFSEEKYHQMTAADLRSMIKRTTFAAATELGRYQMTGVLWECNADRVKLVATDGRRLALTEGPAIPHGGHATSHTPVVPSKAMGLLERNLQVDDDQQVCISIRPNEAMFRTEVATIYTRLVEGRYPNYREVFPKKSVVKMPLAVGPFLAAVRQSAIMADEDTKRVIFHFARGKLTLEAKGGSTGRSRVEMPLEYEAKPIDISFNPQYVVDFLRVLELDAPLTLDLVDGATPAMFRTGENYSYLVMPLA
jgi:DNA polymerase-3 subunit beta